MYLPAVEFAILYAKCTVHTILVDTFLNSVIIGTILSVKIMQSNNVENFLC